MNIVIERRDASAHLRDFEVVERKGLGPIELVHSTFV
jgi:hypothetical protein